jgi:hypothetical protein
MQVPTIKQTKFLLAVFAFLVATVLVLGSFVALWLGKPVFMDATSWWAAVSSILALYGAGHVVDTHLQQKKAIPADEQVT